MTARSKNPTANQPETGWTLVFTWKSGSTNFCVNDPSAGSPTETLLRLLLPLNIRLSTNFHLRSQELGNPAVQSSQQDVQSVGATGGVYKGQGRNQHELMTRTY